LYKPYKRPAEFSEGSGSGQTARTLLEDNKQLVVQKQQRKALERQRSREFVDRLFADDRLANEADKAKQVSRSSAQRGLAQYYKAKIAQKEADKKGSYKAKLDIGGGDLHFPFVEGETICQNRQAEAARMREEMRGFLKKQREDFPPRMDPLMLDTEVEYHHQYPLMPAQSQSARGPRSRSTQPTPTLGSASARGPPEAPATARGPASAGGSAGETGEDGDEDAPHLSRYPRFLSRAREHMSRRIHDAHVRKALEDKVAQTKSELEALTRRRQQEAVEWEEGLVVNDALRFDGVNAKSEEKKRNAEFVQAQIKERKAMVAAQVQKRRAEPAGYWGPEEKGGLDPDIFRRNANEIIQQMEVNQNRRLESRHRKLDQERMMVDNSVAEMSSDRAKEQAKVVQHKQILTSTWDSQKKIREVMKRIEKL